MTLWADAFHWVAVALHCMQIQWPLTLSLLNMGSPSWLHWDISREKSQRGRKQNADKLPKVQDSGRDQLLCCGAALIAAHGSILSDLAITINMGVPKWGHFSWHAPRQKATSSAVGVLSNTLQGSGILSPDICERTAFLIFESNLPPEFCN